MTSQEKYLQLFPTVQEIALQLTAQTGREWIAEAQDPSDLRSDILVKSGNATLWLSTAYNDHNKLTISGAVNFVRFVPAMARRAAS